MKPAALVFLRDNVAAQRLAVAWPLAFQESHSEKARVREWARLADVPPHQAVALAAVLRAHGICRDDGTVDPLAEQYVANQVVSSLKGARK